MTMQAPSGAGTWQVTGQTETTQITPGGQPVRGVNVFYTTGLGHQGSVFVPYSTYNADTVRRAVGQAAAQMDEVGQLSGGPGGS
jgi:hypothetical protein